MTDAFAELSSQLGTMNETLAKLMRGSLTLQWVPGRDNVLNSNADVPDARATIRIRSCRNQNDGKCR